MLLQYRSNTVPLSYNTMIYLVLLYFSIPHFGVCIFYMFYLGISTVHHIPILV